MDLRVDNNQDQVARDKYQGASKVARNKVRMDSKAAMEFQPGSKAAQGHLLAKVGRSREGNKEEVIRHLQVKAAQVKALVRPSRGNQRARKNKKTRHRARDQPPNQDLRVDRSLAARRLATNLPVEGNLALNLLAAQLADNKAGRRAGRRGKKDKSKEPGRNKGLAKGRKAH